MEWSVNVLANDISNRRPNVEEIGVIPEIGEVVLESASKHLGPIVHGWVKNTEGKENRIGLLILWSSGVVNVHNVDVKHEGKDVEQMHHASEDVMSSSILVPLELDKFLNSLGFVDNKLLSLIQESHEVDIRVQVSLFATVLLILVNNVLSNNWKQVD
mgnify:CR=1 FL=1